MAEVVCRVLGVRAVQDRAATGGILALFLGLGGPVRQPSRGWLALATLALAGGCDAARAAPAAMPAPEPPGTLDGPCGGCHAALVSRKHLHPPLDGSSCTDCHAPAAGRGACKSPTSAAWRLVSPAPELCAGCHDAKALASQPVPHAPVLANRCAECHDAHGSDAPHLLRQPGAAQCLDCHDARSSSEAKKRLALRGSGVHAAVTNGCDGCHVIGHGGKEKGLLFAQEPALCTTCHPEPRGKTVHAAVRSGCTGCHEPHASAHPALLRAAPGEACDGCHDAEALAPKPYVHAPAVEGQCVACHDPHATDGPKLLRKPGADQCLACHDAKAPAGKGTPRADARIDRTKKVVHLALEAAGCEGCHEPGHSSDREHLLRAKVAELCQGCHDRKSDAPHVHGAVALGACTGCHDPHASDEPALLRRPLRAACASCHHDDISRRRVVHAPVAAGRCTGCHDPHAAKAPKLLKAGPGAAACAGCHPPVDRGKVKHAALRRYGCTGCHDPHGAAQPRLLPKKTNALCATCHPGQKDGGHVMKSFGRTHPVEAAADPRREGRPFDCASCHEPHASDHRLLFRSGEGPTMCDGCHGNISGANPGGVDLVRRAQQRPPTAGSTPSDSTPTGAARPAPPRPGTP